MAMTARVKRWRTDPTALDLFVAMALAIGAGAVYAATAQPEWQFDTLQFATFLRDGQVGDLLRIQHSLGNLLGLVLYELFQAIGIGITPLRALGIVNIGAGAGAIALTFAAGRRLGASRLGATASAGLLAATLGAWRGAAQITVYGVALGAIALTWFALARYIERPSDVRAGLAGAAAAVAVASHLAALVALPSAALVAWIPGGIHKPKRLRSLAILSLTACLTGAALIGLSAGIATGWSLAGMSHWTFGRAAGAAAAPNAGLFGFGGLLQALAGGTPVNWRIDTLVAGVGVAVSGTILALVVIRGALLVRRPSASRVVAVALLLHSALAFVAAAVYNSIDLDYFALGTVSMVILLSVGGTPWTDMSRTRLRFATVGVVVAIASLATWNFQTEVGPNLRQSRTRRAAAAAITRAAPPGSHVLLSPFVAPSVAYEGPRAETGWSALLRTVSLGGEKPGLAEVVAEFGDDPLLVSSAALDLTPEQSSFLGTDTADLWSMLRSCCELHPTGRFVTDVGPEILYRVEPTRDSA